MIYRVTYKVEYEVFVEADDEDDAEREYLSLKWDDGQPNGFVDDMIDIECMESENEYEQRLYATHVEEEWEYYLVPFKKKGKNGAPDEMIATFILGAKGYKQLAMRTGQYLDIDVIDIKEGEYKGRDKYTGKQTFEFIDDDDVRENLPTVGYMAYFELLNGFKKTVYWTKTKMLKHADQYSQAFKAEAYEDLQAGRIPDSELWKYSSFWYKDFDGMAHKTMIRHLISQWGIMSTEMQTALAKDGEVFEPQADDSINEFVAEEKASISNDSDFDFFDN